MRLLQILRQDMSDGGDLMKYHYKAFISYRHAGPDTKVAVEIQNHIERYIIPGSIRKELGIKSIGRVFRDKDELPSTSDLNENIKNAIRNSEYLICICSPRYIESIWGRKEIEFFLESHDKRHVLTVLAEGEPDEAVPDILCSETVTVQDENGNDVTIEKKLEPLSCDYRGDRHRARTEEFPRLAAVLIGCGYADLRQKMRKRRMRMMAAAAVLASVLLGCFIWSYINIQVNYRQSLINQSRYLASSAQEAIDNNDNVLAAQLSLAALPDQGRNRPVVPEAVYTLSQAIGAYQPKRTMNIRGVASYSTKTGTMSNFLITADAHYMAVINSGGDVAVYNLAENRKIYTISTYGLFGSPSDRLTVCGKDRLVIYNRYREDVALINISDGEVLWHQQFKSFMYSRRIIALGEGENSRLLLINYDEIIYVNAENGEIESRYMIRDASGGEASAVYMPGANAYCCVDAENACYSILCQLVEEKTLRGAVNGVLTCYYETGRVVWTPFSQEYFLFEGISKSEDGCILFAYTEKEGDYIVNDYYKPAAGSGGGKFGRGKVNLVLVKEGTGEVLWQNSLDYTGVRNTYSFFDIRTIPADDTHSARTVVLAAVSNKVVLFDVGDGSIIKEITLSDWVVSVNQQIEWGPYVRVNGASGSTYYFDYYSEEYNGFKYTQEPVDDAYFFPERITYDGVASFIVRQGDTIRVLKFGQGDDDCMLFEFEPPDGSITDRFILGTKLVLINRDCKVYIYDLESEKKLFEMQLDSQYHYTFLGCAGDNSCIYMKSSEDTSCKTILRLDLEEGNFETVDITRNDSLTGAGRWEFDTYHCVISGDYIFYRAANYNSMTGYWVRYSMKDGSCTMIAIPYFEASKYAAFNDEPECIFSQDGTRGILYFQNAIYLADFESGKVSAVDAEIPGMTIGTFRESDGMFVLYYMGSQEGDGCKELHAYNAEGKELWKIDNLAERISAVKFHGDRLIAAMEESKLLCAYDARSGEQIGMIELDVQLVHSKIQIYDGENGELIIDDGVGSVFMVDYENWALIGAANEAIVSSKYCPALKRIIFTGMADNRVGYCRCYSVSNLVEKGKAFVGEQTMSEADKAKYGLSS